MPADVRTPLGVGNKLTPPLGSVGRVHAGRGGEVAHTFPASFPTNVLRGWGWAHPSSCHLTWSFQATDSNPLPL